MELNQFQKIYKNSFTNKYMERGIKKRGFNNIEHPIFKLPKTFRQKTSDRIAGFAGSWFFLILLILLITFWIYINELIEIGWDPKPYILLNLTLNIIAVIVGPIILMSQKRQEERDRIRAMYDHQVNVKAEKEIRELKTDIREIKRLLKR